MSLHRPSYKNVKGKMYSFVGSVQCDSVDLALSAVEL
jgi:hypothetical protein